MDTFPTLVKYNCQICQEEIKHQKSSISSHLLTEHDTTMEEYGTRFHSVVPENSLKRKETGLKDEDKPSNKRSKTDSNENSGAKDIKTEGLINLPWYSASEFACALCEEVYFDVADLTSHAKDTHNVSKLQYRDQYQHTFPSLSYYECQVCKKEVNHQHSSISKHLM